MRATQQANRDTCLSKIRYWNAKLAKTVAKNCAKRTGRPIRAYKCVHCTAFHIGGLDRLPPRRTA